MNPSSTTCQHCKDTRTARTSDELYKQEELYCSRYFTSPDDPICGSRIKIENMMEHWKSGHFKCEHCGNRFAKLASLKEHRSLEHSTTTQTQTEELLANTPVSASHGDMQLKGKKFKDTLDSCETEMRSISDSIQKMVSAYSACSDGLSTIPKISDDLSEILACQDRQSSELETMDSAIKRIKQDLVIMQNRNEHIVSNQAEIVSISMQKGLKKFEENFKKAMATRPADPNPGSSSEAANSTIHQKEPVEFIQSKPVSSINQGIKAASHVKLVESEQVRPVPSTNSVESTASQVESAEKIYVNPVSSTSGTTSTLPIQSEESHPHTSKPVKSTAYQL